MARSMSPAAIAGLGGVALLVAACEGGANAEPDASTSPTPAAAAATPPAEDDALRELLAQFEPEIDGFELFGNGYSPVDSADAYYGSFIEQVEPVECLGVYRGLSLGTDADLGSSGGDLINPAGPYIVEGSSTNLAEEMGPSMFVETRVFGDPEVAATMRDDLAESECTEFTSTWVDGDAAGTVERVDSIDEVSLDGLDEPSVRVVTSDPEQGAAQVTYVHVTGPYGIAVKSYDLEDDPALAGRVIEEFLSVMGDA